MPDMLAQQQADEAYRRWLQAQQGQRAQAEAGPSAPAPTAPTTPSAAYPMARPAGAPTASGMLPTGPAGYQPPATIPAAPAPAAQVQAPAPAAPPPQPSNAELFRQAYEAVKGKKGAPKKAAPIPRGETPKVPTAPAPEPIEPQPTAPVYSQSGYPGLSSGPVMRGGSTIGATPPEPFGSVDATRQVADQLYQVGASLGDRIGRAFTTKIAPALKEVMADFSKANSSSEFALSTAERRQAKRRK